MTLGGFTFSFPIWVEFGNGVRTRIGPLANTQGWDSALIVTDPGIVAAGLIDDIDEGLTEAGINIEVYDDVAPNPTVEMVEAATAVLKEGDFDALVAVGGGSVIDTAKSAALLRTNDGALEDYEVNEPADVTAGSIDRHPHPLVTIPTTAGTGSEVDFWAVITAEDRSFKMAIGQPPLRPGGPYLGADIALVDPELTASLPPRQTAATGFDAFSHALENHVAAGAPALVKPYTTYVMGLVPKQLPKAYHDGDMAAREWMLCASSMAGFCENYSGFGAIHSLAEVTGGIYPEIPHGEAIAVFTPPVMRFNLQEVPGRYAEVAQAMGLDVSNDSVEEAARAAVQAVEDLIDAVDLPSNLRSLGVAEADLPDIANMAMDTIEIHDNPREATAEDLLRLVREAY